MLGGIPGVGPRGEPEFDVVNTAQEGLCGPAGEFVAISLDLRGNDGTTLAVELGPPAGGDLGVVLQDGLQGDVHIRVANLGDGIDLGPEYHGVLFVQLELSVAVGFVGGGLLGRKGGGLGELVLLRALCCFVVVVVIICYYSRGT